ncbi:MAG: hypothetical protein WDW36_009123 [Sanguina aurantia]
MQQNAGLLVLVAHNGKQIHLDVQPSTRVEAVQQALVLFTGLALPEQIVMFNGARLDPSRQMYHYKLPVTDASMVEEHPVFLFSRALLRPGAATPPAEPLPPIVVNVPELVHVSLPHPLHSSNSPAVRSLPDYERHFQHHLMAGEAVWQASQARLLRCRQLLSEQEVQARAADAARANVDAHFSHIAGLYHGFMDRFTLQHSAHHEQLARLPDDLHTLSSLELLPALQQQLQQQQQLLQLRQHYQRQQQLSQHQGQQQLSQHQGQQQLSQHQGQQQQQQQADLPLVPRLRFLSELAVGGGAGTARLRERGDSCRVTHNQFAAKVSELGGLFEGLQQDVEGLFMQAPSVDLDGLGSELAGAECQLLDEQSSVVAVLAKDLATVRKLVEDTVAALGSSGSRASAAAGHDSAKAMEAIQANHVSVLLPRLTECDAAAETFLGSCIAAKERLTTEVLDQLRSISAQQSKIRDMKNKLAAFNEVMGRQEAAVGELRAVHRLPSAYRLLLAECVRRCGWSELYVGQATRLAEHMARVRAKEVGRREAFHAQVERYLPQEVLHGAGLAEEPPRCGVSLPQPSVPLLAVTVQPSGPLLAVTVQPSGPLLAVTAQDMQRLPSCEGRFGGGSVMLASSSSGGSQARRASGMSQSAMHNPTQQQQQLMRDSSLSGTVRDAEATAAAIVAVAATAAARNATEVSELNVMSMPGLEMDNARLRAEIATHIAAACIRELSAPYPPQPTAEHPAAAASPASASTAAAPAAAAAAATGASAHSATAPPTAGSGSSSGGSGRLPSRPQSQAGMVHAAAAAIPAAPSATPTAGTEPQRSQAPSQLSLPARSHISHLKLAASPSPPTCEAVEPGDQAQHPRPRRHSLPRLPSLSSRRHRRNTSLRTCPPSPDTHSWAHATTAHREELLTAFRGAMLAKEDLIAKQHLEILALAARNASYEARIQQLEARAQAQQHPPPPASSSAAAAAAAAAALPPSQQALAPDLDPGGAASWTEVAEPGSGAGAAAEMAPTSRGGGTVVGAVRAVVAALASGEADAERLAEAEHIDSRFAGVMAATAVEQVATQLQLQQQQHQQQEQQQQEQQQHMQHMQQQQQLQHMQQQISAYQSPSSSTAHPPPPPPPSATPPVPPSGSHHPASAPQNAINPGQQQQVRQQQQPAPRAHLLAPTPVGTIRAHSGEGRQHSAPDDPAATTPTSGPTAPVLQVATHTAHSPLAVAAHSSISLLGSLLLSPFGSRSPHPHTPPPTGRAPPPWRPRGRSTPRTSQPIATAAAAAAAPASGGGPAAAAAVPPPSARAPPPPPATCPQHPGAAATVTSPGALLAPGAAAAGVAHDASAQAAAAAAGNGTASASQHRVPPAGEAAATAAAAACSSVSIAAAAAAERAALAKLPGHPRSFTPPPAFTPPSRGSSGPTLPLLWSHVAAAAPRRPITPPTHIPTPASPPPHPDPSVLARTPSAPADGSSPPSSPAAAAPAPETATTTAFGSLPFAPSLAASMPSAPHHFPTAQCPVSSSPGPSTTSPPATHQQGFVIAAPTMGASEPGAVAAAAAGVSCSQAASGPASPFAAVARSPAATPPPGEEDLARERGAAGRGNPTPSAATAAASSVPSSGGGKAAGERLDASHTAPRALGRQRPGWTPNGETG